MITKAICRVLFCVCKYLADFLPSPRGKFCENHAHRSEGGSFQSPILRIPGIYICTHSGGELANLIAGSKNFLIGSGFDRGIGWWKTYIGRICCWKHISIKATENIYVKLHTFKLLTLQQIYSGKSHLWVELGTRDNGCDNMNTVLSTTNCRLSCYR